MAKIMLIVPYAKYYVHFLEDWLYSLRSDGHEVIAVSPDGPSGEVRDGIAYRRTPLRNTGRNPVYDTYCIYRLVKLLREERPDMLCCYSLKPNLYGTLAAAMAGISYIYLFVTGVGYVFASSALAGKLLRLPVARWYGWAIRRCSRVFFENGDDAALFAELGMPLAGKAVMVNGSGVNLDKFAAPFRTAPPQTTFLLAARLLADKGITDYVQAAAILRRRYPGAVFQLLGPPDRNPAAIPLERVQAWAEAGDVHYLGETEDVRPFLRGATVFVLPSYREGTPKTVLEAMAMGLPIVTTDAPGCRETVEHGVNGWLVPVRDVEALAEAMERFLVDGGLAVRMGEASRRIAMTKFDVLQVHRTVKRAMGIMEREAGQ